jgi:uncharacterized delta-60 repeat protein
MNFEGIPDSQDGGNYYSGGAGGRHGIYIEIGMALVDSDAGGTGLFANEPSAKTALTSQYYGLTQNEGHIVIDVPGGFSTAKFYYSASEQHTWALYSGLVGTGTVLASGTLAVTPPAAGDPTGGAFGTWVQVTHNLSDQAKSLVIYNANNDYGTILIDDLFISGRPGPQADITVVGSTSTSATIQATINPNGLPTTAYLDYGPTTSYGTTIPLTLPQDDALTDQVITQNVTGLTAGQTYYFQVRATSEAGAQSGQFTCTFNSNLDLSLQPTLDHVIKAAAVQPDGKLLLGGQFQTVNGSAHNYLVRFNQDGTLDTSFQPTFVTGSIGVGVAALAVQPDGKILAGGDFDVNLGTLRDRKRFGRFNADGSLDTAFLPEDTLSTTFINGKVTHLAVSKTGQIVLAGDSITAVGGSTHTRIARLNADGTVDNGFTGAINNNGILALAVQDDGKVVVSGTFTTVNSATHNYLVRFNTNGTVDSTFNPTLDLQVEGLTLQPDGKLLIVGMFTTVNGVSRVRSARLKTDGTLDTTFNPPAINAFTGGPTSVAVQANGKVIIGGSFISVTGLTSANGLVRFNADGSADPTLQMTQNPGGITLQGDGKIVLPHAASATLIRLFNEAASDSLAATATQATWTRSGSTPEACRVTMEKSTDGGATWTPLGNATKISTGWQLTGLNLTGSGQLRARAFVTCSTGNGSQSIVERVASYTIDLTPPSLGIVTVASNNANPGWARLNNTVTLGFTATEPIQAPSVTLLGMAATAVNTSANNWTATATVGAGTAQGPATFAITATDLAGNTAAVVSSTTNGSSVQVDKSAPTLNLPANITVEATTPSGAEVTFTASASDNLDPSPTFTISNTSGSTFAFGTTVVGASATDHAGNTATGSFSVTVLTHSEAWRQEWFGTTANAGDAADDADPNGNGIKNLLEYALDGDPRGGTTGSGILPQSGIGSNRLQLVFSRSTSRTDVVLTLKGADSPLGPWTDLAVSTGGAPFTVHTPGVVVSETRSGALGAVTATDLYLITDPAHPRRYLRLEAAR